MLISAVELAGLQLPKLPNSRQGIEYHAKKNNWPFEEVAGRARGGKLKKYLVSALPSEVQAAKGNARKLSKLLLIMDYLLQVNPDVDLNDNVIEHAETYLIHYVFEQMIYFFACRF